MISRAVAAPGESQSNSVNLISPGATCPPVAGNGANLFLPPAGPVSVGEEPTLQAANPNAAILPRYPKDRW